MLEALDPTLEGEWPETFPLLVRHAECLRFSRFRLPLVYTEIEFAAELVQHDGYADMCLDLCKYTVLRPGTYEITSAKTLDLDVIHRENEQFKEISLAQRLLKRSLAELGGKRGPAGGRGVGGRGGRGVGAGGRGAGGRGVGGRAGPGRDVDDYVPVPPADTRAARVLGVSHPSGLDDEDNQSIDSHDTSADPDSEADILARARARERREERWGFRAGVAPAVRASAINTEAQKIPWGTFSLARLHHNVNGEKVCFGWGATCNGHFDSGDLRVCKKQVPYGTGQRKRILSDREAYLAAKAWCIAGIHISPCSNERTVRIGMDPREFNMEDYNEVDMGAIANSLPLRA